MSIPSDNFELNSLLSQHTSSGLTLNFDDDNGMSSTNTVLKRNSSHEASNGSNDSYAYAENLTLNTRLGDTLCPLIGPSQDDQLTSFHIHTDSSRNTDEWKMPLLSVFEGNYTLSHNHSLNTKFRGSQCNKNVFISCSA